jgi:hypothetical protein
MEITCSKCGKSMRNNNFGSVCEDCFADNIVGFEQYTLHCIKLRKKDEEDKRKYLSQRDKYLY